MELKPMVRISIALLLTLAPTLALADQQAAQTCAASLQPGPRAIYEGTVANLSSGQKVKDVIKAQTVSLVQAGTVSRESAKTDAQAAVECLKLMRQ